MILAVPYDKRTGFCIMKQCYKRKTDTNSIGLQFEKNDASPDLIIKKESKYCKTSARYEKKWIDPGIFLQERTPRGISSCRTV